MEDDDPDVVEALMTLYATLFTVTVLPVLAIFAAGGPLASVDGDDVVFIVEAAVRPAELNVNLKSSSIMSSVLDMKLWKSTISTITSLKFNENF